MHFPYKIVRNYGEQEPRPIQRFPSFPMLSLNRFDTWGRQSMMNEIMDPPSQVHDRYDRWERHSMAEDTMDPSYHGHRLSSDDDEQPLVDSMTKEPMVDSNEILVDFDGQYDPTCPLNWDWKRKWTATLIVSCFTFISPFSSTMVTPALGKIGNELDVPEGFMRQLVMTIFLLGYAQGPFVLAPLSEIFGRVCVLQYANLIYLVFNTACGFAQTKNQMLAFRFLSGIGGAAPQALCNGVLADTWRKEERGKGQAVYGILTFIGPAIAPIIGAVVSSRTSWRWIFWATSMFDVLVQLLAYFCLSETYHPKILANKAKKIRAANPHKRVRTIYDDPHSNFARILRKRLILPFLMMLFHPAVQAPSIYRAFLYGIMYLVLSTFGTVWEDTYGMSKTIANLNYISLGAGFIIGLQISHPLMDKLYAYFQRTTHQEDGVAEWRVPPMLIGGVLTPIGLLIYGWAAEYKVHWIVPNIGTIIMCIGLIIAFQCSQAYITDAYSHQYAASASAVGAFLRTMCGFAFPLWAPALYNAMGVGRGNTLLAFLTLGLAIPSPILLWFYGHKLRAWSTYGCRAD